MRGETKLENEVQSRHSYSNTRINFLLRRHEKTKVIDEFTTERIALSSKITKLQSFNSVVGKKDSEQLELIKELQADLNARAKMEREKENYTFKLESELDSVKKDFSFESQRMKEVRNCEERTRRAGPAVIPRVTMRSEATSIKCIKSILN